MKTKIKAKSKYLIKHCFSVSSINQVIGLVALYPIDLLKFTNLFISHLFCLFRVIHSEVLLWYL